MLLLLQSDSDSNDDDVEEPRVVASDTDEGAGGLAATLGLAGARPGAAPPTDGDGSADAEEIINRAVGGCPATAARCICVCCMSVCRGNNASTR